MVTPAIEARLNERQRKMMQWFAEGKELTSRQCEAEFGVTRPVTAGDFGKLVKMGLAEKIGAGRSTRYRFKGQGESLSNRKVDDGTIFGGIHQLMAQTDTPKKKIRFAIKEKQVLYSNKTKRKKK